MEQPITITELRNRFCALKKKPKYPMMTVLDVENLHQKSSDAEKNKLLRQIRQRSDRVLAILNTANQLYDFRIEYRMLSVLITFISGTKTNSFCLISNGTTIRPYSGLLVYLDKTPIVLDGINIYANWDENKIPDKKIIQAVLDDFDTIEEFFYDYLDYLSQGYVFKERYAKNHRYNTIYRIRGNEEKVYYYNGALPQPILKNRIKD